MTIKSEQKYRAARKAGRNFARLNNHWEGGATPIDLADYWRLVDRYGDVAAKRVYRKSSFPVPE